jgi:cysteine desulfurase
LAQDVSRLGVDLATFDAQKLYGPKGVGALYRARGVPLRPIQYGGKQEGGLRPGTPPTPFIVGFAKAFEIVYDERDDYVRDIAKLRNVFFERVLQAIPTAERNGAEGEARLANNINISFPGLEGEQLVIELDTRGVACSTRSACLLTEPGGSYIVQALGKGDAYAESSVRFTLGRNTTKKEVMSAVDILIETVRKLQGQ